MAELPRSAMDDLRQASAEVSGVQVLSPATLNVWDAFCNIVEDHGPPRRGLAAALRAAADQVVPPALCVHNDDLAYCRDQLLAIVAELEAANG